MSKIQDEKLVSFNKSTNCGHDRDKFKKIYRDDFIYRHTFLKDRELFLEIANFGEVNIYVQLLQNKIYETSTGAILENHFQLCCIRYKLMYYM